MYCLYALKIRSNGKQSYRVNNQSPDRAISRHDFLITYNEYLYILNVPLDRAIEACVQNIRVLGISM